MEMADTSTMLAAPTVTAVSVSSMFQTNSTALIGSVAANWRVVRPGAVLVFNVQSYGL